MLEGFLIGLETALSIKNLLMVIGGCIIGTFIGMLPGLGPMSIIAIMIPVAISIGDPSAAIILLAGVYYGAVFGGSTSSILINAPGVASTVATSFDGYPMTRQGKAGKALTIAAIASFAGGTIGAILLVLFAPALASVALLFHSSEYFALMVVGLSAIAAFAGTGQITKAVLMTIAGLVLATIGEGAQFNMPRFTMGIMDLQSGIGFITLAMAMFAIPETLFLILDPNRSGKPDEKQSEITNLRITKDEAKQITPVIARQSLQGFLIGVMPGAGATIASFLGYAVERNLASPEEREQFGKKLSDFQAMQFKIADMVTELVAARTITRLAAYKIDQGDNEATTYSAMAKRFATDVGFNVCNEALQIFGGYGYIQDYPLERNGRDVRVHQILEGTNEIMKMIIGRRMVMEDAASIIQ